MKNTNSILDPYWVTGFTDAEGCFSVRFTKNKLHKIGWYISPVFIINLHIRDKNILKDIKSFFDCGTLYYYKNKQVISYAVLDINNINKIIIPHFERYPLITQKLGDYVLWKNIIELMNEKIHLNKEGLKKIVNLKASLNRGLTKKLEICFPDTIKVKKPITSLSKNMDYNWFAGFFTGDGCFFIDILKSKSNKTGYTVTLRIIIGQHSKDEFLINSLINFLLLKVFLNCNLIDYFEQLDHKYSYQYQTVWINSAISSFPCCHVIHMAYFIGNFTTEHQ